MDERTFELYRLSVVESMPDSDLKSARMQAIKHKLKMLDAGDATKEARRSRRLPYIGVVGLTWKDPGGETRFAQGECIDISEGGLRVEALTMISTGARVMLNPEPIKLSAAATAKHVMRCGSRYTVGLELSQATGSTIRESSAAENCHRLN
jgi:hypothetical protein